MTTVNEVPLCPKCEHPLTTGQRICPSCRWVIESEKNPDFEGPAYISLEHEERKTEILDNKKQSEDERTQALNSLELNLERWGKRCSDDDRIGALQDAHLTVRTLILSDAGLDVIREVTKIGRAIGRLSEAVETYASRGGEFNVREVRRLFAEARDPAGDPEATA